MVEKKTVMLRVGGEVLVCECTASYDEAGNVTEIVSIDGLWIRNVAEKQGVPLGGVSDDLVIEARLKQLVAHKLKTSS